MNILNKFQFSFILILKSILIFAFSENSLADNSFDLQDALGGQEKAEKFENGDSKYNKFIFSFDVGYRRGSFNWNEGGNSVNILSELKLDNLDIKQIGAAAKFNIDEDWMLQGKLREGFIYSGSSLDSDYNGNNRTLLFSQSQSKSSGELLDLSLGLGRALNFRNIIDSYKVSLTALGGWSVHQQLLSMREGFQVFPSTGYFIGLDNSYDALWQGPWLGIEAQIKIDNNWSFKAASEYHWSEYTARANWNLRSDLLHPVSFIHKAIGNGVLYSLGGAYFFSKVWQANFALECQKWHTDAGIDQTYYMDGTTGYYRLNEVNWESVAAIFGLSYFY